MTAALKSWLENWDVATIGLTDMDRLEHVQPADLLTHLRSVYPLCFLEGRRNEKEEYGFAVSSRRHGESKVYRRCLLITIEGERVTGISLFGRLRLRGSVEPQKLELHSTAGFSIFHDVDGWKIKMLEEKRVILSRQLLTRSGWRFEQAA